MVSTATKVGQFTFANCLMNAAGVHCMTKEELAEVEASAAGSFVTKTGTLEARPGNPEPRYVNVPLGSINSMGLPNNGFEYYLDYVIELQKQPNTKNHFLSLVGLSPEETHTILKKVQESDYEGLVELNLSCPNVPGKPQIAYDFETTTEILTEVFSYFTKPLGVKLPPYFDIVHFDQAAAVFNQFPLVFVNCVNSIEEFTEDSFSEGMDEERGMISFDLTGEISEKTQLLLQSMLLGIEHIAEEYGKKYVQIINR